MLGSIAASKTAKLLGTCICPVVGAAGVTMAVPKVKNAVHKATAPREYALPKTRVRPAAATAAPCIDPVVLPLGTPGPLALNDTSLPDPFVTGRNPTSNPLVPILPSSPGGGGFDPENPGIPVDPNPVPPVSAIPEPMTWVQIILGFGLIGGSIRAAATGLSQRDEDSVPTSAG